MKQVKTLITTYCTILLAFVLQKPLFLIIQQAMCPSQQCGFWSNISAVVWHGLTLDISMAGYLSIVPCLTMIASIWVNGKIAQRILNGYFWVAAALIACSFVLNMALYPFWNYPLDSTPLFYFFTSPAMPSPAPACGLAHSAFCLQPYSPWQYGMPCAPSNASGHAIASAPSQP